MNREVLCQLLLAGQLLPVVNTPTHKPCADGSPIHLACADGSPIRLTCADRSPIHLTCTEGSPMHIMCADRSPTPVHVSVSSNHAAMDVRLAMFLRLPACSMSPVLTGVT
jgi:hypothetical protein